MRTTLDFDDPLFRSAEAKASEPRTPLKLVSADFELAPGLDVADRQSIARVLGDTRLAKAKPVVR